LGLVYHHLPETIYDSGKTRTNPKEAEAVADAVMEHAAKHPKQTLGVIAFSTSQMQAIQLALEVRRRKKPELESYFRSHSNEPFVVKNLENVQGDERDVIFISLGYGRTEDGKVPQRFGPLNNNGGERRLNVLITRAKYRCEVFTNMTSEDIQVTQQSKLGVQILKSFLYFAQHGKFNTEEDIPIPIQTPFEDYLAAKLKERGYTIRQKVGMEGVYIDLAVVDDTHPDRYLLGIDCDGHSYNNARSARDRDRLRRQILELIGWRMYRAWSLDWLYHSQKELERLIQAIEKVKDQVRRGDEEAEAYEAEISVLMREKPVESMNVIPPYSCAELPSEIATQEFHLHPVGKIIVWLQEVVRVEGPVHFDEAAFRLTRAAGISKIGSRIRECLEQAAKHAEQLGDIKIKNDFLWHKDLPSPVIRDRSNLPAGSRKIQYIATEELALGVKKVVEDSIAIQPDAAMPFIAKLFGFSRLTDEMKKELSRGITHALVSGSVKQEGELLRSIYV
jgi:very-short-patch-repair endonuclease